MKLKQQNAFLVFNDGMKEIIIAKEIHVSKQIIHTSGNYLTKWYLFNLYERICHVVVWMGVMNLILKLVLIFFYTFYLLHKVNVNEMWYVVFILCFKFQMRWATPDIILFQYRAPKVYYCLSNYLQKVILISTVCRIVIQVQWWQFCTIYM